jgi:UDP-N-acetyl-D-mannosaminuronic acid dehydrogenase
MGNGGEKEKIGVLGLGHVGLTLGLVLAEQGFRVHGYDTNPAVSDSLKAGKPHFEETGLPEILAKHNGKNFVVVDDFQNENTCGAYLMTVGTPLDPDKKPDYDAIISASRALGRVLKKGDLVILRSTVPLGTTREIVLPILEYESGLTRGEIKIAFAPERTIEGDALKELRSLPQVVGGLDDASTDHAAAIFSTLTDNVIKVRSLEEAEMVKLINNTYRETVFSFANEISIIARKWGLDTKRVIKAANDGYPRSFVPMPSPGVGGYCLTKDGYLLMESAKKQGFMPNLVHQARYVSAYMLDSLADEILEFVKRHRGATAGPFKTAILGFAFKGSPATSDMRGSTTLTLIKRLRNIPVASEIYGFDPHVSDSDIESTGVIAASSIEEALRGSDVVVIMNNNPHFKNLPLDVFTERSAPTLLYDTWGLNDESAFAHLPYVHYRTL